jgi:hypothetical protein
MPLPLRPAMLVRADVIARHASLMAACETTPARAAR